MIVSPAKTGELIEMPFMMWTRVGPESHVLDGSSDPHLQRGNFEGEKGLARDIAGSVWQWIYSKQLMWGSASMVQMPI